MHDINDPNHPVILFIPEAGIYPFVRGLAVLGDAIRKQGGKKVALGMMNEHTVLKNWYKKLGFRQISTRKYPHLPFSVTLMGRDSASLVIR